MDEHEFQGKTEPELLTIAEAAGVCRISEALLYALCASGDMPHVRIGMGRGTIRIDRADLIRYLERKKVNGSFHGKQAGEKRPAARPARLKHLS